MSQQQEKAAVDFVCPNALETGLSVPSPDFFSAVSRCEAVWTLGVEALRETWWEEGFWDISDISGRCV